MVIGWSKDVLGGGVSTGAEWYEPWEAAKLLHGGGVFFSGVGGVSGSDGARTAAGLADWEHAGRKRVAGGGGTG